jgi:hypothetical protein
MRHVRNCLLACVCVVYVCVVLGDILCHVPFKELIACVCVCVCVVYVFVWYICICVVLCDILWYIWYMGYI